VVSFILAYLDGSAEADLLVAMVREHVTLRIKPTEAQAGFLSETIKILNLFTMFCPKS